MVILHIAHVGTDQFAGVNVAIPQQIRAQQQFADIGFVNLTGLPVSGVQNQFGLSRRESIAALPVPFCSPDLVVFHEVYRPIYLQYSDELRKRKIPYIIVPHGGLTHVAQRKKRIKKAVANVLLFDRFILGAEAVQCLSERERTQTERAHRRFVGTNGIRVEGRKEAFSSDGLRMVYVGRLEIRIKGLDLLLDAIQLVRGLFEERQCSLDIYGPDESGAHAELQKMVDSRKIGHIVSIHGAVSGEEKAAVLFASDCFVQTSRSEGMSMGLLEALGYGLPCVVTEGTGMAGLICDRKAGWACETTAVGIAEALRQVVLEHNTLREKSDCAAELAKTEFSWDAVAKETMEQYRRILDEQQEVK